MRHLIQDQQISATTTTSQLDLQQLGRSWLLLAWQFELVSGSGSNYLTIAGKATANWETDAATEVDMELDHTAHWRGPRIVSDAMISAAPSSKLKAVSDLRAVFDYVKITFTYSGAGSRIFKVNLWAR